MLKIGENKAVIALSSALEAAVKELAGELNKDLPENLSYELESPKFNNQGDKASSAAMRLAKVFSKAPRDIALKIVEKLNLNLELKNLVDKIEVAGPGFINFFLSSSWFSFAASDVLDQGEEYGALNLGDKHRVQVEFVSSNPTGPLHIGHGRGAAVGDSVARILEFTGWDVQREYYINDAGLQIETLGKSTQARYFELFNKAELAPFPENGYKGEYLYDIANKIKAEHGDKFINLKLDESLEFFKNYASDLILKGIEEDLKNFGVKFDKWFSEKSLYVKDGQGRTAVSVAMQNLKDNKYAFEQDGALWFRSTDFGDDKDRVLIRNNGVPTYFASDIAYHHDKFIDRNFERVIDVWGADHHGYIARLKAGIKAMGKDPDKFEVLLIQLVNLLRGGKQVAMSTRSGEFIELKAVCDEVGVDATRFFFLTRRSDSQLDFDLELAKSQSSDNPVYYVQYAHARIASIMREFESKGGALSDNKINFEVFNNKEARELANILAVFPKEVESASRDLAPQIITDYALNLAGAFHSFYNTNRILNLDNQELETGRVKLACAVRNVIARCLNLLGVSAPERM
ncbi:MAG: arginine--tRNA ligase [Synergistaceae bacterium]|nr:arginine--tRNA ligase [Synergistaceae bacterium]MBQ4418164.1 arginine--tRNA ligase [Synergistaceae bacterium]